MKKLMGEDTSIHINVSEITVRDGTLQWVKPTEELPLGLAETFLPPQLRWISADERFVVLEFPPSHIMVNTSNSYHGGRGRAMYRIPTPWTVYIVQPDNFTASVFARSTQLTSLDDEVYTYHMCNLHRAGDICLGQAADLRACKTAVEKAFRIIWHFWQTTFSGGFYTLVPFDTPADSHLDGQLKGLSLQEARARYLPDEVLQGGALGEIGSGLWADTDKYFTFLESVSLIDICRWSWKPHGTVTNMLAQVGYKPQTKFQTMTDLLTRGGVANRI